MAADYRGKYALAPDFDSYERARRVSRILGDPLMDDAFRVAASVYAYFQGFRVYDETELEEERSIALLRFFNAEVRPHLDRLMLILPPSDAALVAKLVLEAFRSKKDVGKALQKLRYVDDVTELVKAFEPGKGRDHTIAFLFSDEIDEQRLEVAKRVMAVARAAGRRIASRLASLRRIGPGFEPAGAGRLDDLHELARLHPASLAVLATRAGPHALATGDLTAIKTYAAGSEGSERVDSLGVAVDVSGSMAGQEIVFASGAAIALFTVFKPRKRRFAFFTSEVHEVADARDFLRLLLTIRPGGGTNIARAVGHACRLWNDIEKVVVISDGRDHPPRDACAKVSYVIVTEDGWSNFGWSGVKGAWLVAQKGDRLVVHIH